MAGVIYAATDCHPLDLPRGRPAMRCSACGTENRADRKFCASCGSQLAIACSNCGASNLPDERYCGECGTPLEVVTPRGIETMVPTGEQAAPDAIAFEPAGERDLKGKALPVRAWSALRVVAGRRGAGRSDQVEAPFVGRVAELRQL